MGPGTVLVTWRVAEGEARVELELRGAVGTTAVWRFQTADARVEPGTLHVLSGDVVELGPAAVAFRLRAGERAAFAFSTR